MFKNKAFVLYSLICVFGFSLPAQAQPENRAVLQQKLRQQLEQITARFDGVMGVALLDLATGEELGVNERLVFPTGSSIKIAVLAELYQQAEEGKFKLTEQRLIEHRDQVGGSGVLVNFADRASALSWQDLATLMIVLSDNTATNVLIDKIGMDNVNRRLTQWGVPGIKLRRKMLDQAAQARGAENTASPLEAVRLLALIHRSIPLSSSFLSSSSSSSSSADSPSPAASLDNSISVIRRSVAEKILATLKLRKNSPIPQLLPANVEVANKPGGIEGAACDWGIVFVPGRPFALAVMTNYTGESAEQPIAQIAKFAYDYYARLARSTANGARVPLELLQQKPR